MMRIAILASTNGTDMDVLLGKHEHFRVVLVIANKQCGALERAKNAGVPVLFFEGKGISRKEFDEKVMEALAQHNIDLVVLIGYMRLLSAEFVKRYVGSSEFINDGERYCLWIISKDIQKAKSIPAIQKRLELVAADRAQS